MPPPPPLPAPPGLVTCHAAMRYDEAARSLLTGLKNRAERARVAELADAMAPLAPVLAGLVVTWAPTGGARRRRRGFDQAELLARAVARRRGLPVVRLLRRLGGPAQAGRSRTERWVGPRFAARAWSSPVLVIDDVATTGATLSAAAEALRRAGVPEVHGLVAARAQPSAWG